MHRETRVSDYDDVERIMIARDYVEGPARAQFENHNLIDETSWDSFEDKMKELFAIPRTQIVDKLHSLVFYRKPGEQLGPFISRLCGELNNYSPDGEMPDAEKVPHLKRILRTALPPEMRYPLKAVATSRALVEEVISYADSQPQLRLTEADIAREKEETTTREDRRNQLSTVAAAAVNKPTPSRRHDDGGEEEPPAPAVKEPQYGHREAQGHFYQG